MWRVIKFQYHSTDPRPNVLWNERGPNPEYVRERREAPDEQDGLLLDQFPCHFPSSYHNLQNRAFYYLQNLAFTIHLENMVQPCPSKTSMVILPAGHVIHGNSIAVGGNYHAIHGNSIAVGGNYHISHGN
jgi:hypothetical protein